LSFKRQSDRGQQWQQFQQHLPGQSAAVTAQLDGTDTKGHGIWDMGHGIWIWIWIVLEMHLTHGPLTPL